MSFKSAEECSLRLVLADKNLVVQGRCFEGFPLLINDDGDELQPAQGWLWDVLGKSGRISSLLTWESYGRAMYDFFSFLQANGYDWKQPPLPGMPSPIVAWRDWSRGILKLQASTINQRLRVVVRFYEWAANKGFIDQVPFDFVEVQTSRQPGFLAHVDISNNRISSPEVLLKQTQQAIRILTKEQIIVCHQALSNPTHQLMFELMVRTGLRQVECRTFPDLYVFDPERRKDLAPRQKLRLHLDPKEIKTKYDKPRDIDLPYDLMEKLWDYSIRRRQGRANNNSDAKECPNLFLTEGGIPYTKDSITAIFRSLSERVGFHVTAHMLRHSYATFLLWSLRKSATFEGEPLLYVRDRMGHADVTTTTGYLHLINSLEGRLVLAHEDEIDQLFMQALGAKSL